MTHHLKTRPEYFQAVIDGRKPFEVRKNDRNFKEGDRVILEEFAGKHFVDECPFLGNCEYWAELPEDYGELEAIDACGQRRKSCEEYQYEEYTGRRCLIKIKEIFSLKGCGMDLYEYVAFTFDVLNVQGVQ